MNLMLSEERREYIFKNYPRLSVLSCCVREFREIIERRRIPLLYLFIEKYKKCDIKVLQSFATGLERDIDAVENAVAYDYSGLQKIILSQDYLL